MNILRLRFGLKGNENDEVQYLALFWMTTVVVQIPIFAFIFLTDLFGPVLLAFTVTMDGVMMLFILLESIVGFFHFRSLLRDEMNIIRMVRRNKEVSQSRGNVLAGSSNPVISAPSSSASHPLDLNRGLHMNQDQSSSEDNDDDSVDNGNERTRHYNRERMDFRMHIRPLSDAPSHERSNEAMEGGQDSEDSNSDSSEQVTSTSDTIRRRPIIAH